jgi:tetratricopeptide (TPR) repeat protein
VIGRRIGFLSERCRRVLGLASVLGREFRLDALAEVSGLSADELFAVIDEAVAARVATEVPGPIGRMRFSHALVRDALYEELGGARRVRLHREVGETLERVYADELEQHLAELAHHFCEGAPGGDVDKAVDYARRAGERAAALLAYEEGVRLFRLALEVLGMKGSSKGEARCRLLLALGDCQAREGDLAGAKETFLRAAAVARQEGLAQELADAALGYGGRFVWARAGSDRHVVPLLEEALRSLPEGDREIRVRLIARLAGALRDHDPPDRQDRRSREAVDMARRIGHPATLSYALEGRFAATWWPDNAEDRLAVASEMLRLGEEAEDQERMMQGHDFRMTAFIELGDVPAVDAELEHMAVLVDKLRQPAQRWLFLGVSAMRSLFDGRFEEAERLILEAQRLGQRAQEWDAVFGTRMQTYMLRLEQGRLAEIEDMVGRSVAEYPTRFAFRCLQAHLYRELDRPLEARRAFDQLAVRGFADIRRDNDWLFEMSFLPEVADFLGDVDRAAILYDLLVPYAGRLAVTAGEASTGSVSRCLGVVASMLRRWDEAVRHFDEALGWNAAMGARPWVAHTQYDYARMLLSRDGPGDRERAAEFLSGALETCWELGMTALDRKVTAELTGAGISADSTTLVEAPSAGPTAGACVFRREGEYWSIRFEQVAFRLRDSKGLRYLARLLGDPGREFLALEIAQAGLTSGSTRGGPSVERDLRESGIRASSGDTGANLDARAKDAYRRRLEELQGELDEAEGRADSGRAAGIREEMDALVHQLAGAVGLGGRDRRAPSDAERARVSVTKAIRAAVARIGEHSPALGRHLDRTIRTGTFCSYLPDPRFPAVWQF